MRPSIATGQTTSQHRLGCRIVIDDRCDLLCLDLPKAERLRAARLPIEEAELAAAGAKALSDPTRLMLAHALLDDELCVCDLAWVAERAENLVSHHVRVLRGARLVRSRRDGKMVMYSLTDRGRAPGGGAGGGGESVVVPPPRRAGGGFWGACCPEWPD